MDSGAKSGAGPIERPSEPNDSTRVRVRLTDFFDPTRFVCPTCGEKFHHDGVSFSPEFGESIEYQCACGVSERFDHFTLAVDWVVREPNGSLSGEIPRWLYEAGVAAGGDPARLPFRRIGSIVGFSVTVGPAVG